MSKNANQLSWLDVPAFQWQTREYMPGNTVYYLEYPEHRLLAEVDPCYPPGFYTYYVVRWDADVRQKHTRIKHWLETGKKHKVTLEEGKRICEDAITVFLNETEVSA
jgi:hypothetical protein